MSLVVHIVDSSYGVPAADVNVLLRRQTEGRWQEVVHGRTGQDGRLAVLADGQVSPGVYQMVCDLDAYYAMLGTASLYPRAIVEFRVTEPDADLCLPVVVSAHSVLSYRGS